MTDQRHPILGVRVNAIELDAAVDKVIEAARNSEALAVSALAVHGLILSKRDPELLHRINDLELVVPDGQPVRWALNWLHDCKIQERVMGPELMVRVCERASMEGLPVYLY